MNDDHLTTLRDALLQELKAPRRCQLKADHRYSITLQQPRTVLAINLGTEHIGVSDITPNGTAGRLPGRYRLHRTTHHHYEDPNLIHQLQLRIDQRIAHHPASTYLERVLEIFGL